LKSEKIVEDGNFAIHVGHIIVQFRYRFTDVVHCGPLIYTDTGNP